jgi:hypothetical protein
MSSEYGAVIRQSDPSGPLVGNSFAYHGRGGDTAGLVARRPRATSSGGQDARASNGVRAGSVLLAAAGTIRHAGRSVRSRGCAYAALAANRLVRGVSGPAVAGPV